MSGATPMKPAEEGDNSRRPPRRNTFRVTNWSSGVCDCFLDFKSCLSVGCCWPIPLAQLWVSIRKKPDNARIRCVGFASIVMIMYVLFAVNVVAGGGADEPSTSTPTTAALDHHPAMPPPPSPAPAPPDNLPASAKHLYVQCLEALPTPLSDHWHDAQGCGDTFTASLPNNTQSARKFVSCVTGWISRAAPKSLQEIASGCPSHSAPATFPWNNDDDDDDDTVEENLHEAIEYFEGVAIEEATSKARSKGSLGATLLQIAAFIALFFMVCQLRVAVRRRDSIPGACCEDVLCSSCCFYCTLCQLMRHEGMVSGKYNLISPTGFEGAKPI